MLDVEAIRAEFPILGGDGGGRLVLADSAATTAKPRCVIEAVTHYYESICANVHRGVNVLAERADALYEEARQEVADLIRCRRDEVVFVRNATEAINLAAHLSGLTRQDEVVCSVADHHSNFLPWSVRAEVKLAVPDADGRITAEAFERLLTPNTRLLAVGHASNVVGAVQPVAEIVELGRREGLLVLIDAAQSVPHMPIDVGELGCDYLAFSGHKMLGPSGIGVLYARSELLEGARPMLYGGGMVARVETSGFDVAPAPHGFEAGTPNIEGVLGLGAAVRFLDELGLESVWEHERSLAERLVERLGEIDGITVRPSRVREDQLAIASFTVQGVEADDVAAILCNRFGIMVRSGVHCAEPLARHFGERSLVRVSLYLYNTLDEVDYIAESLDRLARSFS